MQYIDLNEAINESDVHVLASRLADLMPRGPWGRIVRPVNRAAVAAFVEDLAEAVADLTREELHVLLRGAYLVRDYEAYQVARVRLYGCYDAYAFDEEW